MIEENIDGDHTKRYRYFFKNILMVKQSQLRSINVQIIETSYKVHIESIPGIYLETQVSEIQMPNKTTNYKKIYANPSLR